MSDISKIHEASASHGRPVAGDLLRLIYDERRSLAAQKLPKGLNEQTIQATALVHEAWLRMRILLQESGFWMHLGNAPSADPPLSSKAKVTVSFARSGMNPARLNDQQLPRTVVAGVVPNFDFWSRAGGSEWIRYEWNKPVWISNVTVFWFADTAAGGGCCLPDAWRLSYLDEGRNWKPVEINSPYPILVPDLDGLVFK